MRHAGLGTKVFVALLALPAHLLASGATAQARFDHAHGAWDALLRKHVVLIHGGRASRVDYAGFQRDRATLKGYLASLAEVGEPEFRSWSRAEQLAFLINAYNAAAVEKILTRYPDIRSIWDFGRLFGHPFKDRFVSLLGRRMSLDDIEHDTIRAEGAYDDPRIHFAVNCAAVTCPMLREEAYVARRLEQQLEEQTVRFLSDRARNRYDPETGALEVAKIFDSYPWYGGDFRRGWKGYTSLEQFFARYADLLADAPEHRRLIAERKARIRFLEYDWGLNDVRR
ncbi:MAG TPA: DUF547 domain-containing protein [Burkholderiales bacterium]|nr:DUF547 domain-containing protein [Burkholderiales bacterium]